MSMQLGQLATSAPTGQSGPTWMTGGRIPSLDGLRAIAILLVIFAHSHFVGDSLLPLRILRGRAGFLGVQVFFVLSGFLITTLMLREVSRTGKLHLGRFYLRRALRIVPVYLAYLVLVAGLQAFGAVQLNGLHWLAAMSYTVNLMPGSTPWPLCHFWSLCVEEHFYLLWPVGMAFLPMRWSQRTAPICLLVVFALRWLLLRTDPGAAVDLLTFTRIDDIAVGCGLAFLAQDDGARRWMDRTVERGWLLLVLGLVFAASQVVCSRLVGSRLLTHAALQFAIAAANDINSFTIAVVMWLVLTRPDGSIGRVLNHPAAVTIGVLSYSAYLWHLPLCERAPSWMGAFPQNLLFIFGAAVLSYRLIEKPFLSLKERLGADSSRSRCDQERGSPPSRPVRTAIERRKPAAPRANALEPEAPIPCSSAE